MKRYLFGSLALVVIQLAYRGNLCSPIGKPSASPSPSGLKPRTRSLPSDTNSTAHSKLNSIPHCGRLNRTAHNSTKSKSLMPSVDTADMKRIERLLTPHPDDMQRYKGFLSLDRTGIFKLFPQSICDESACRYG